VLLGNERDRITAVPAAVTVLSADLNPQVQRSTFNLKPAVLCYARLGCGLAMTVTLIVSCKSIFKDSLAEL
jgi:hypothetical protein